MDDWSNQFKSLLDSPLGKELVRALIEDLHDTLIADAEKKDSQEKAFTLLCQARGVMLCIDHLKMRAVTNRDEGGI